MTTTNKRKGIILAGGSGSRLYPLTKVISKQLLPVFDKPMIYYPLATLMIAGIREILLISTPKDISQYQALLGDGGVWGINISYQVQPSPDGLAQAFILAEDFIANDLSALILGDNIFHGNNMSNLLLNASNNDNATIFAYHVSDPERYGVVEFDNNQKAISIEEKPKIAKSNYAVTGLYFYDNKVVDFAKSLKPSHRGELEITDLNKIYMNEDNLNVEVLNRGFAWLDSGTHESLLEANQYIATVEKRQGQRIACIEEISFRKGWITKENLLSLAEEKYNYNYRKYLKGLIV
ncbi:glucose-1-phosphate thymidylyltransferase RfbA [Methylophilaceae bacterium]|jgi:glucose-1-phosphate thymidylyltransferase|nr:glucose-1-phosphate thymidylyltransferase RfbA [Methylophilaceae bacterium]|tara:strand:- start:3479 stop:4357 length:879 start_codon:yes stop_codon:yes gene_type:complete